MKKNRIPIMFERRTISDKNLVCYLVSDYVI